MKENAFKFHYDKREYPLFEMPGEDTLWPQFINEDTDSPPPM